MADDSTLPSAEEMTQTSEKEVNKVNRIEYEMAMKNYGTGRYQLFMFVLLSSITISTAYNNSGYIFIGASQKYVCKVPNSSWTQIGNQSIPVEYIAGECTYSTYTQNFNGSRELVEKDIRCNSWNYNQSEFILTIMSEWDLNSCNGNDWKVAFANSLYMVGFLIGCIVLADLSDRYGRSLLLLVSNIGMLLSGCIAAFSVNYEMLVVMRLLLGIFTAGARNAGYVYACEIIYKKYRPTSSLLLTYGYVFGSLAVTAISQLLPNWRHFQLACAVGYICYIPYYWLMPESPRWMLAKGRNAEVKSYFRISAKINKVEFPENFEVYLEDMPKSDSNMLTLFKTPNLRKKTLVVSVLWFSVSIVYFGMVFNVGNLAGNIFINNYILSLGGLGGFLAVWHIKLGRRIAISSSFILGSLVSVALLLFSLYEVQVGVLFMGFLGIVLLGNNFSFVYVVTSELYPTSARVTALGLGSCLARVGSTISPYLVYSNKLWNNLPYVIFAIIAIIAGLTATLLPETKGRPLPDSLFKAESEDPINTCSCFSCQEKK